MPSTAPTHDHPPDIRPALRSVLSRLRKAEGYLERIQPVARGDAHAMWWARVAVRRAIEELGAMDRGVE